jgi:glucose-1-phosphate adenylyltransferase
MATHSNQTDTLAVVLAGGEGRRLQPLTQRRAKPAIPFGGSHRLIDFVMSNLVNSGLLRILTLTQYQPYSLIRHLARGWNFSAQLGHFCEVIPASSGPGRGWYQGSADALFQNLDRIERDRPRLVAVFGADHIYRMDVGQMIDEHLEVGADVSVAVVPQPIEEAHQFGCIEVDDNMRIENFLEKPEDPPVYPKDPTQALVSMGNYIFNADLLRDALWDDHADPDSAHDIGGNIVPRIYKGAHAHAYNFFQNGVPGATPNDVGYWRDVGTIAQYWKTSMDLVAVTPSFNMYNYEWPILTAFENYPPAKFVFADRKANRVGVATDSLVSNGVIISGGRIDSSVLSPSVRINSFSSVKQSVLFTGVDVGRRCKLRKTIVDKNVQIPPGMAIGYDEDEDRARGITVTPEGVRVVPGGIQLT